MGVMYGQNHSELWYGVLKEGHLAFQNHQKAIVQICRTQWPLYTGFADKVDDKEIKKFLLKLAKDEKEHFDLIKMHEESIYNYWYWDGMDQPRLET